MILDNYLLFSNGQSLTQGAGSVDSTNIIDLGVGMANPPYTTGGLASPPFTGHLPPFASGGGARDIAVGDDPMLKIFVECLVAFVGGTSVSVAVAGAPDNGNGAAGSFTTMATGPTVLLAALVAGARVCEIDVPRPAPGQAMPRFLKLVYTTAGTFTGAGGNTVTAGIVID